MKTIYYDFRNTYENYFTINYRPKGADLRILYKAHKDYIPVFEDLPKDYKKWIILDIGAHIGCFAQFAQSKGFKKIICYESDKENFFLLSKNITGKDVELYEYGVRNRFGESKLWEPDKENSYWNRTPKNKRIIKEVAFKHIIETHQPNIIKIDIEGREREFEFSKYNEECVKRIIIELHYGYCSFEKIDKDIKNCGFQSSITEEDYETKHNLIVLYKRD